MNGIYFVQLQQYVNTQYKSIPWESILIKAGVSEGKRYFSGQQYEEEEFFRIFRASINLLHISQEKFLDGLGVHISSNFIKLCQPVIKADWRTLDLLEHIEEFNSKLLQTWNDPSFSGKFTCKRVNTHTLSIEYLSPRKLCPVLAGLIKGVADHYNEKIIINETSCSLRGDPHCLFLVSLAK